MRPGVSGESGAVELLLEARAAAVGFAQVRDQDVDTLGGSGSGSGGVVVSRGELAHLGESFGSESVVLGAGVGQFVLHQALVDRQYGERVDLLVGLDQLGPGVVAVQGERVRKLPRPGGVVEGEQCERDGLAGAGGGERCSDLVGVVVPTRAGALVQPCCGGGRRPATEDVGARVERLAAPVFVEEMAPVVGGLERLVPVVEVGGLFGPVDRQVDLADLLERLCGVLEPRRDLPVHGVGADDGVDVVVQDGEALRIPVEGEPLVGMTRGPALVL